ncbi:MAG: hypothetical protein EXR52_01105 [Dehalococcoidia bacterium]|nr:hypothetical protein [Dehalococcoidia bacterium]
MAVLRRWGECKPLVRRPARAAANTERCGGVCDPGPQHAAGLRVCVRTRWSACHLPPAPLPSAARTAFGITGENPTAAHSTQALLHSTTALLVYLTARKWLSAGWAMSAGAAAWLYPGLLTSAGFLLVEPVLAFLMTAATAAAAWASPRRLAPWGAVGTLWGLAALCKPVALASAVLVLAAIWAIRPGERRA